jgi:serine/threonine protein kinase
MLKSLYELNGDPDVALASLTERYPATDESDLLNDIERLLADVSVQPDVIAKIQAVYRHEDAQSYPAIRGPLGLCVFLDLVTRASLHEVAPPDILRKARTVLGDPTVKASLRNLYKLDVSDDLKRCSLEQARLHEIGTTSMIIDCEKNASPKVRVALKCVLPRHFSVRAITEGAKRYGEHHQAVLSIAPKVYGSNDRAVMMEFIPGRTLASRLAVDHVEHLPDDPKGEKRAAKRALGRTHIEFIRELGRTLCDVLETLNESGQSHLDLSPRNILLVREKPLGVRLIDFGRNFAIAEGVASSLALARASVYVEPQMITRQRTGDWRSDCYSLGIILLEAAARQPLHRETIARELWRLWTGEHSWDGAPGLARIIEDLIDAEPSQRLVFMSANTTRPRAGVDRDLFAGHVN